MQKDIGVVPLVSDTTPEVAVEDVKCYSMLLATL